MNEQEPTWKQYFSLFNIHFQDLSINTVEVHAYGPVYNGFLVIVCVMPLNLHVNYRQDVYISMLFSNKISKLSRISLCKRSFNSYANCLVMVPLR